MTTLRISDADPAAARGDVLVVGVTPDGQVRAQGLAEEPAGAIAADLRRVGCDGKQGATWRIPAPAGLRAASVLAVGMSGGATPRVLREAAGAGTRAAGDVGTVVLALPNADEPGLAAVCEGGLLGGHPPLFLGAKASAPVRALVVTTAAARSARTRVRTRVLAETAATTLARDLVNEPPVRLTPEVFARTAKQELSGLPVKVNAWDPPRLAKAGMGGILAVGQGSANPPRLIILEYRPKAPRAHLAFVGKGITFDSGGLSLKTAKGMETMKCDMAGAAAVLAATKAIAELGLPVRISAYLACAENMPSGTAQRPGDVITMHDGTTVEVLNTDAEGRLVMADALALAGEQDPDAIIDVATLTGAQMIALGTRVAAVMGNDGELAEAVVDAGAQVGESFWPMPLPDALKGGLTSQIADLKNIGEQFGGMLYAGLFLQTFVPEDTPWAHLDIAGPAFNEGGEHGFTPRGGTGFAARTLIEMARRRAG
jgi:leucyl aminopeptidase